jgi:hypothetical protein
MRLKISTALFAAIVIGLFGCGKSVDPATRSSIQKNSGATMKRDASSVPTSAELPPLVKSIPIAPGAVNEPRVFSVSN